MWFDSLESMIPNERFRLQDRTLPICTSESLRILVVKLDFSSLRRYHQACQSSNLLVFHKLSRMFLTYDMIIAVVTPQLGLLI